MLSSLALCPLQISFLILFPQLDLFSTWTHSIGEKWLCRERVDAGAGIKHHVKARFSTSSMPAVSPLEQSPYPTPLLKHTECRLCCYYL